MNSGGAESDVGGDDFLDACREHGAEMKSVERSEHDGGMAPAAGIEGGSCLVFHVIPPWDFEEASLLSMLEERIEQALCPALDDFAAKLFGGEREIQFDAMEKTDGNRDGLRAQQGPEVFRIRLRRVEFQEG